MPAHVLCSWNSGELTALRAHAGQFTDVPAGDIGVGAREVGFMFGQYKCAS